MVIFSSLLFFAEQTDETFDKSTQLWMRSDGTVSPFQSIPETFWWCITTMTTVGYGDTYPVSPLGKFGKLDSLLTFAVAALTMLCGILTLAFPISILGSTFTNEWNSATEDLARAKLGAPSVTKRYYVHRMNELHKETVLIEKNISDETAALLKKQEEMASLLREMLHIHQQD